MSKPISIFRRNSGVVIVAAALAPGFFEGGGDGVGLNHLEGHPKGEDHKDSDHATEFGAADTITDIPGGSTSEGLVLGITHLVHLGQGGFN